MLSVRMRASLRGKHVSGAERIVDEENLTKTVLELLERPKSYDEINLKVERVEDVSYIDTPLKVSTLRFRNHIEAREKAIELLSYKVKESILREIIDVISTGANLKGWNMRGAILVDVESGDRLESDSNRGVRTVLLDWQDRETVKAKLLREGYTERTLDALAIATKNVFCGVEAEICWSDDEDYVTGYVASPELGYVRLDPMKKYGDPFGGRAYFVRRERLREVLECLERKALLIKGY